MTEQNQMRSAEEWMASVPAQYDDWCEFIKRIQKGALTAQSHLIEQLSESLRYANTIIGHPDDEGMKPIAAALEAYRVWKENVG